MATLHTTLRALCSVLYSVSTYDHWLHECRRSNTVEKVNDTEGAIRIVYSTGVGDRDVILGYKIKSGGNNILMELVSKPELSPEEKGLVRVKRASGHWRLTPKQEGTVEVEYQFHMDPEPPWFIPRWLVNSYVPETPYCTLIKLRKEVDKTEHRSASVDCVR